MKAGKWLGDWNALCTCPEGVPALHAPPRAHRVGHLNTDPSKWSAFEAAVDAVPWGVPGIACRSAGQVHHWEHWAVLASLFMGN